MDLRFVIPMSSICERLFLTEGYAFSDRIKAINPGNLEMQLFLDLNQDIWNCIYVNGITVD